MKPLSETDVTCWCRMTVVEGWFGGIKFDRVPSAAELNQAQLELIEVNAAINSQVTWTRPSQWIVAVNWTHAQRSLVQTTKGLH